MEKEREKKAIRRIWRNGDGGAAAWKGLIGECMCVVRNRVVSVCRSKGQKTPDWVQCVLRKVQESRACGGTL